MAAEKNEIEIIAKKALRDNNLLAELLEGLSLENKNEKKRHLSFQVLNIISEENPEVLYKEWDFFIDLLDNHAFCQFPAIYLIANLTKIDKNNKFEKIFEKYFNLLANPTVSIASHASLNAGKIANYKPKLRNKITKKLLNIDTIYPNPERVDLVKSYVIDGLGLYFENARQKKEIIEFVKKQLNSKSGKTKKIAKIFLKNFNS
jgi:hypothetical protein